MEAFSSTNDLLRVHSTESGVRLVVHGWSSDTERDDSSVDETVVLEIPYIIQISSFGIWYLRLDEGRVLGSFRRFVLQ